jgi:hypothetical protein
LEHFPIRKKIMIEDLLLQFLKAVEVNGESSDFISKDLLDEYKEKILNITSKR